MNAKVAPGLENIISKALEKDRDVRYQHASDIRADLKRLRRDTESGHTASHTAPQTKSKARVLWAVVAGALILATGLVIYKRPWAGSEPKKALTIRDITANSSGDPIRGFALSPDGKQLAYTSKDQGLILLEVDTGEKRQLLKDSNLAPEDWYPDGAHLLASSKQGIWKVSTFDGKATLMVESEEGVGPIALSQNGEQIAFVKASAQDTVWEVNGEGQDQRSLVKLSISGGKVYVHDLAWAPNNRRILVSVIEYAAEGLLGASLQSYDSEGNANTVILKDDRLFTRGGGSPVIWLPDGRIIFCLNEPAPNVGDTNLWTLRADPGTGRPLGQPSQLTHLAGIVHYGILASKDGQRLAYLKGHDWNSIQIADLNRATGQIQTIRPLGGEKWESWSPVWTAEGRGLLFDSNPRGKVGIFKRDLQTNATESVVTGADHFAFPAVAGRWILFDQSSREDWTRGLLHLMRMPATGGPATLVTSGKISFKCAALSGTCLVAEMTEKQLRFSLLDPVSGHESVFKSIDVADPASWGMYSSYAISSDGKKIATIVEPKDSVAVFTIDGRLAAQLKTNEDQLQTLGWDSDGQNLYVTAYNRKESKFVLLRVGLNGRITKLFDVLAGDSWISEPCSSPDGSSIAFTQRTFDMNVAMLENF